LRHLHRSKHCDVYSVHDDRKGAAFAAKVVRPDLRDDAAAVERILVEGVRLALIRHPGVLRCERTIDEPPGNLLELIDGPSLASRMRDAPFAWLDVASLGAQLASALDAVHRSGLVHTDVKPSNVLCDGERYVLIDLDLARPPGPATGGRGTRYYMAPEQVTHGGMGPAIRARGPRAVLFRAATGRHPFDDLKGYPQTEFLAREVAEARRGGGEIAAIIDGLLQPLPQARPLLSWVAVELARLAG